MLRMRPLFSESCVAGNAIARRGMELNAYAFGARTRGTLPYGATCGRQQSAQCLEADSDPPCQEQATHCWTKMQACGDFPFDSPESPPWRRPSPTDCPAQHGGAERPQLTGQELLPSAICRRCSADRAAKRLRVSGSWPCASMPRSRDLTFDMSGGAKGAKRPLGRPLDGGVRPLCHALQEHSFSRAWRAPA